MKRNIFATTPGITGLAQVTGYDMSDPEKLSRIDQYYIENRCLKMDFQIFLATFFKSMRANLVKKVYEI
jgi:O-antigen biosynthesis protein WbqP